MDGIVEFMKCKCLVLMVLLTSINLCQTWRKRRKVRSSVNVSHYCKGGLSLDCLLQGSLCNILTVDEHKLRNIMIRMHFLYLKLFSDCSHQ